MKRIGLPRALLVKLVASVACAFLVTVSITWLVQTSLADRNALKVINRDLDDIQHEIEDRVNRKLVLAAMEVRDQLPLLPDLGAPTLRRLASELRVDEVDVVNGNGVIVASVNPTVVGFDFRSGDEQAREFLCLLETETEYCQAFRARSADGQLWKYVGVWCPEGGFVQVGCLESTLRVFAQSVVMGLSHNNHIAGTGSIVITTGGGHVISAAKESGLEGSLLQASVEDAYVVHRVIEGFDVYAVLPKAAAVVERNMLIGSSAVMTILALCFIAVMVGVVISRFVRTQVEERIQAEMVLAKSIQTNSLPSRFPPYPNLANQFDIFAKMVTAKEVGGDFYDFYFAGPDRLALVIADVSGKGVSAALYMMRAKATIQSSLKSGLGIVEAVEKANHRLTKGNDANMFVTAWVGIVDLKTGELEYVNAGHNPPLVKRADGSVAYLKERSGLALAAMDGLRYRSQSLKLAPGDGLLLYTDGVTEAIDCTGVQYGEERLQRTMRNLLGAHDAEALIDGVLKDVTAFAAGAEQSDDITLFAFKLLAKLDGGTR